LKLIIASNNEKKLKELRDILSQYFEEVLSMKEAGIFHETIEDQPTFLGNALKKAGELQGLSGCATLADDSGLEVDALNGAPGVYSARFAGEHGNDALNNALLLEKLQDTPYEKRTARFKSVVALVFADGTEMTGEGTAEGIILRQPRGENGFGYDPLFFVPSLQATFAELPADVKNALSHRAKAIQALVAQFHGEMFK